MRVSRNYYPVPDMSLVRWCQMVIAQKTSYEVFPGEAAADTVSRKVRFLVVQIPCPPRVAVSGALCDDAVFSLEY